VYPKFLFPSKFLIKIMLHISPIHTSLFRAPNVVLQYNNRPNMTLSYLRYIPYQARGGKARHKLYNDRPRGAAAESQFGEEIKLKLPNLFVSY
jgi:hypothetical protein